MGTPFLGASPAPQDASGDAHGWVPLIPADPAPAASPRPHVRLPPLSPPGGPGAPGGGGRAAPEPFCAAAARSGSRGKSTAVSWRRRGGPAPLPPLRARPRCTAGPPPLACCRPPRSHARGAGPGRAGTSRAQPSRAGSSRAGGGRAGPSGNRPGAAGGCRRRERGKSGGGGPGPGGTAVPRAEWGTVPDVRGAQRGGGVQGKRSRGSAVLGAEGGSHRPRGNGTCHLRTHPAPQSERGGLGGCWRREPGDGRGRLTGTVVLSSARIPRWGWGEKGGQRASPSPAARGTGGGGTARSPSSLSRMATPAILLSPAAEGSGQAQDPFPLQWAPPPHPAGGDAGCEDRARPGAGSWRGEPCPSPCIQAPWSNPAW